MPYNPKSAANLKKFEAGNKSAGRIVDARNVLTMKFVKALRDDFEKHGDVAIVETREKDPAGYLRMIASLVPKDINITKRETVIDELSDGELAALATALREHTATGGSGAEITPPESGPESNSIH